MTWESTAVVDRWTSSMLLDGYIEHTYTYDHDVGLEAYHAMRALSEPDFSEVDYIVSSVRVVR